MKKISLISSCYNEEENLDTLYDRVIKAIEPYSNNYEFEYILLDNGSCDNTEGKLRELAQKDKRIKVILNARNLGHIRSPYYGMVQCSGDAIIYLASDLQDPPELIGDFIKKWEEGYKIVLGKKTQSEESFPMFMTIPFADLSFVPPNPTEKALSFAFHSAPAQSRCHVLRNFYITGQSAYPLCDDRAIETALPASDTADSFRIPPC